MICWRRRRTRCAARAGSYERKLVMNAGVVTLKGPWLRSLPFETQIIKRYRRCESRRGSA
ncbi:MAG: transposase [Planctomycetales bacterium]|nr:transposase [Planctomycetales bacterium]